MRNGCPDKNPKETGHTAGEHRVKKVAYGKADNHQGDRHKEGPRGRIVGVRPSKPKTFANTGCQNPDDKHDGRNTASHGDHEKKVMTSSGFQRFRVVAQTGHKGL